MLWSESFRRKSCAESCSLERWGRHAIMTALLCMLSVAILCDSYFLFVPVQARGGPLGSGAITISISPLAVHLQTAGRLVKSAFTGR